MYYVKNTYKYGVDFWYINSGSETICFDDSDKIRFDCATDTH